MTGGLQHLSSAFAVLSITSRGERSRMTAAAMTGDKLMTTQPHPDSGNKIL